MAANRLRLIGAGLERGSQGVREGGLGGFRFQVFATDAIDARRAAASVG